MHRLSNMELHSPRLAWLLTLLSAQSASSRDQNWVPHMAPCPGVISLITGWFHLFSLWKGQHLFLVKYTYFGHGSSFPAYHTSAKTIIHGLKNALSTFMVFTQHYFWSKGSLYGNEVQQWAPAHGTHWSYHALDILKQLAWRMVDWPPEASGTAPVRWQYFIGPGQGSPGGCTSTRSESASNTWQFLP